MKHELKQPDKAFFGHPYKAYFLQSFGKGFLIMVSTYSLHDCYGQWGWPSTRPAAAIVGLFAGSMYLMTVDGLQITG